jgi:hypothetical protein
MTRFHHCTVRRLWRRCMVIWALNTVPASAGHCCPALLPTCEIAGKGVRPPAAAERAPWIRIRRLRLAKLRFAQQAGGCDKKRDDQHAHHISLPVVGFACLSYYQFCRAGGMSALGWAPEPPLAAAARRVGQLPMRYSRWPVAGPRWRRLQAAPGIERDYDARTIGWISGQNLDRIGSLCLLAMLKTCPPR